MSSFPQITLPAPKDKALSQPEQTQGVRQSDLGQKEILPEGLSNEGSQKAMLQPSDDLFMNLCPRGIRLKSGQGPSRASLSPLTVFWLLFLFFCLFLKFYLPIYLFGCCRQELLVQPWV